MTDPIDDLIRQAGPPRGDGPKPDRKTNLALAILLAIAALLIALPLILALTGDPSDTLFGLATGDTGPIIGGNQ